VGTASSPAAFALKSDGLSQVPRAAAMVAVSRRSGILRGALTGKHTCCKASVSAFNMLGMIEDRPLFHPGLRDRIYRCVFCIY
jgi:hypothetical protein